MSLINSLYSLKQFYKDYPNFNYHLYRNTNKELFNHWTEIQTITYWYNNGKPYDFLLNSYFNNSKKDIIIYLHLPFISNNGGVIVQYNFAKLLDTLGERVRICNIHDNNKINNIFNNFYDNDLDLNNSVIIYCEGVLGNPLKGKYIIRWILSELGTNVSYENIYSWNRTDNIYYFNNQSNFNNNEKLLSFFYINNTLININKYRSGYCYTLRKSNIYHRDLKLNNKFINTHFEITRDTLSTEYNIIFNKYKYFICFDPLSFLQIISILCGCICIVYPIKNISKQEWYKMTALYEYMIENNIENIYGIAYGNCPDEISFAEKTIHLCKKQIDHINNWFIQKYVNNFINDIN